VTRPAIGAALVALAACTPSIGPLMDPGQDCVECHNSGEGPDFTFAGTVFPSLNSAESDGVRGVKVRVTDSNGKTVTVVSNEAGNFYLRDRLAFPLVRVEVERDGRVEVMDDDGVPIPVAEGDGGCNRCHTFPPPPDEDTAGRLVAP
jgi:hypothetical protein